MLLCQILFLDKLRRTTRDDSISTDQCNVTSVLKNGLKTMLSRLEESSFLLYVCAPSSSLWQVPFLRQHPAIIWTKFRLLSQAVQRATGCCASSRRGENHLWG